MAKQSELNVVSGFLETGSVIFGLRHFGVTAALICALLYQVGNLTPFPLRISRTLALCFSLFSGIMMIVGIFIPICGIAAVPFLLAVVQSVRSGMKTDLGKMRKRTFRIIGFLLGFCFVPALGAVCAAIVLYCVVRDTSLGKTEIHLLKIGTLQVIMILHQMHYFVYCYAVMIIAYQFGGALLAASLFFAGWLTYVFAPLLYKKIRNYRGIFLFGHSLLVLLLLSIFFAPSLSAKAILWLLTGFGGTTEVCYRTF